MQLFSGIKDKVTEYIDVKLRLYQINIEEKAIDVISVLSFFVIIAGAGFVALLFVLLFIAKLIGFFIGFEFWGYGIVALICIFMLSILIRKSNKDFLITRIKNLIAQNIKDKNSKDHESI